MVRAYSLDLRERVVAAVTAGETCRSVAVRFGVSVASVVKWSQRVRRTGSVAPDKFGRPRPFVLEPHRDWVLGRIAEQPDLTIQALVDELAGRCVKASRYAVWNFLRREAISFKKSLHAAEQDRPDAARRRARWRRHQAKLDPRRLVFIDETWAKTNMTRTHGRCARGRRLRALAPHGHWKTMTFIAALRCDAITAPVVFDQPINGEWFKAYVEQVLVPTLSPGDVVVMDNLGSRRGKAIRRAIRQVGAKLLFLPKYSPDLNPIEQVFSKLKHLLRKAQARSCDAVLSAINRTLRTYAPDECQNYFQNSGYGVV